MRFPVVKGDKPYFPACGKCAWCKSTAPGKTASFATIEGGAILLNRKRDSGGPDDRMEGFLDITWHGGDLEYNANAVDPDIFENVFIADFVKGGQFDITFCSTECLRAFLNHAVDKLEEKVAKERKKLSK